MYIDMRRYAKKLWSPFTKPRLVFDRCFTAACGKVLIEATPPFFVGYASNQRLYHIYIIIYIYYIYTHHIIPYYPIYIVYGLMTENGGRFGFCPK